MSLAVGQKKIVAVTLSNAYGGYIREKASRLGASVCQIKKTGG